MWVAFLRAYQFLQKIMPLRVMYDAKRARFVESYETSARYWFINSQVVQAGLVAYLRMFHYLQTDKSESGLTFIDFVVDLLIWSVTLFQSCLCWSAFKRRHCLAWFLNQYMTNKDIKTEKMDLETIMLYSIVGICLGFPVTLGALPLIFSNTAVHQILGFWLPRFIMSNKVLEIVLCALYFIVVSFFGMIPVLTTLLCLLIAVIEGGLSLKPAFIDKREAGKSDVKAPTSSEQRPEQGIIVKTLSFSRAVKIYKRGYMIWESVMQFGYILYPCLMLTAFLLNVVTTFACIKLYNELPPAMVGMLATIDVAVVANTVTFHAFALVICIDFEKFYWFWKTELRSKRNRRVLMACVPTRVKIGIFFSLESSTILATFNEVVDMTVTLLLA